MSGARSQYPERERAGDGALAYLITWRGDGTWLHGDARGSVEAGRNVYGSPFVAPNPSMEKRERSLLGGLPFTMELEARAVVEATIAEVSAHRGWALHACQARSNHVHVVVSAARPPERVMTDLKAWCSRRLAETGITSRGDRLWSHHGSTVYLWDEEQVARACHYVLEAQDLPHE